MSPEFDDWLAAARDGDNETLGKLLAPAAAIIRRHYRPDRRRGRLPRHWSDSDIAQIASIRAIQNLSDFQGQTSRQFFRWVFQIARTAILDERRADRREKVEQAIVDSDQVAEPSSGDDPADAERNPAVRRAVELLLPRERRVVRLHYWKGWTHARIAGAMGASLGAVQQVARRARAKLRRVLVAGQGRLKAGLQRKPPT